MHLSNIPVLFRYGHPQKIPIKPNSLEICFSEILGMTIPKEKLLLLTMAVLCRVAIVVLLWMRFVPYALSVYVSPWVCLCCVSESTCQLYSNHCPCFD